ncbi:MAG: hypothetical protein NWP69_14035 [Congregibacter sp.]|nr:hypothetical protein [Congregibacter sp.]
MAQNKENKQNKQNKQKSAALGGTVKGPGKKPRKSLVAFLSAIKFRKPSTDTSTVDSCFAQPQPRARQRRPLAEENYWVRSAN